MNLLAARQLAKHPILLSLARVLLDIRNKLFASADAPVVAGDVRTAAETIPAILREHSKIPDARVHGIHALVQTDCIPEAIDLEHAASVSFPNYDVIALENARIAESIGDLERMAEICASVRARHPEVAEAWTLPLRHRLPAHFLDDVPFALATNDPGIAKLLVLRKAEDGELDAALTLCRAAIEALPDHPELHGIAASLLRETGLYDEAALFVEIHMARFPSEPRLAFEFATIAEARGDLSTSARRWRLTRDRFPHVADAHYHTARLLNQMGDTEAADAILAPALDRFPADRGLLVEHATAAAYRGAWDEALHRWRHAAETFPDDPRVIEGFSEAGFAMAMRDLGTGTLIPATETPILEMSRTQTGLIESPRDLFLHFESLGDNCEFGLVQRLVGAEPLGMLRWATIEPEQLVAALDAGFDGVGDLANVEVRVSEMGEYIAGDLRWFLGHTFVASNEMPRDRMALQVARRLQFLKAKLLADLREADKIFVYKTRSGELSDDWIADIHRALRAHGPVRLMCVRHPPTPERNATVEVLADGLYLGYVADLGARPQKVRSYAADWIAICRAVVALQ